MKNRKEKNKMDDKKAKDGELETQSTPYDQWDYRIETRGLIYKQFTMGYMQGLGVFPAILIDNYGSQDESYERLQVWVTKQVDETLVSDFQAMADALPEDSPRKATFAYIANMVASVYDSYVNPPDWSDLP
ncbi:hypothetical protein F4560_004444 [Saccharothrix ecbatanensis]|uniref:Uncharacterized protein n=1 Tax=Saccharothrix ecbatanensis TaxID=1105145 RepID=A0A7W9HM66_9PSEU|nr:hypothetical protein [Saccharothrix ecbatanensis]MBB5804676.1 hypothetical protein [Saccharothrix ecbatanensis]